MPDRFKGRPLRVALVGYGFAGEVFHAPLIRSTPGLSLTLIGSREPARVREDIPDAVVVDYAEAISHPEIDLVVVATPNDSHAALARSALAAGKHVVVDKPFTVTPEDADELVTEADRAGLVLSVFHNRRWDSDFLTVRRLVATGAVGEIVHFEANFNRYRPQLRRRWREQSAGGGGLWYDLGAHLIDQALQLFGMPETLTTDLAIQRDGAEATDYFHAVLGYGRCRVVLHGAVLVPCETPRFTLQGTVAGYVKFGLDTQEDALRGGALPGGADWGVDTRDGELTDWSTGQRLVSTIPTLPGNYPAYYAALRDCILAGGPNPVPASEAATVIRLIHLGIVSSATGRTMPV
ncbi:MAG: oxidoreductase [Capsulimonadaceae bacterium]